MTELNLWCYVKGATEIFYVSILPSQNIYDPQKRIYTNNSQSFTRCNAVNLRLTLTDVALDLVEEDILNGRYWPNSNDRRLLAEERISAVWPEQPNLANLHMFITPPPGGESPILDGEMRKVPRGAKIGELELSQFHHFDVNIQSSHICSAAEQILLDIYVKVMELRKFKFPDLYGNKMEQTIMDLPTFVIDFLRMLGRKPTIDPDSTTEETRYAGLFEVLHTCEVALFPWEELWQGGDGHLLKERGMASVFFDRCAFTSKNGTVVVDQNKEWPLRVVVKSDNDEDQYRQFKPRSNYLISISSLPRLLMEVNSTSETSWPMDLIRMLITGAYIVRFANKVVPAFQQKKNFVLCAIFVWDNDTASHYVLYQHLNDDRVFWDLKTISLNDKNGRVTFVRYLYNLRAMEEDPDTEVDSKKENTGKRPRTGTGINGDNAYEGAGNDPMQLQLRAHGFEVKQETIIDDQDVPWDLIEKPDNVLTVYRPLDPNKEFIAKKVRKGSDELEILRLLDTIKPKSHHIISLFDFSDEWIVLPKMVTVKSYIRTVSMKLGRNVVQVCSGLIDGLEEFHLQIIDSDIAMRVKDEDEEVDYQCGMEGWMAPEVAKKLKHSPIKADRWACGRVILFLLDTFKKKDESLGTFARHLCNYNPELRPRLHRFRTLDLYRPGERFYDLDKD